MKSGKRVAAALLMIGAGFALRADLPLWIQHQPAGGVLDALTRWMPLPGGRVRFELPPRESRPALTKRIGAEPKNAALYRLRAHEDEMQLDFAAAANDWRAYAGLAPDRGTGYLELADYYHRRVQPAAEIAALQFVGQAESDQFLPVTEQRSWQAYAHMLPVIKDAGLPAASAMAAFHAWIRRYPKEQQPRRELIHFLTRGNQYAGAEAEITAYARAVPADASFPVEARANLAAARAGDDDAAIRVYDRAFQPLWPKELTEAYFKLLDSNGELRGFLARAREAREKNPADLDAAARLFTYWQHENNFTAARRALFEYRLAKEARPGNWTASELETLAGLFDRLPDANEEARAWYALYSVDGATAAQREAALAGMIGLLVIKADQPVRFGTGDLSLYKDIATADSSPGFLNGLLSLVLNSTSPRWQYQEKNAAAPAYFHRAEGTKLLDLFDRLFPASRRRSALHASVIDAYAGYGDDDAVITSAQAFLAGFPRAAERTHVAMALADALARTGHIEDEFAVYDRMLAELASRASGVLLGVHGGSVPPQQQFGAPQFMGQRFFGVPTGFPAPQQESITAPGPRSPEYAQVLDKYLARLAAARQPMRALRVYRTELDRNPNDPGLYERFAGFLEQNRLGADVEDVYRRAIARFADKSWYHKLARWYLRQAEQREFAALSRDVTHTFAGTELESYFGDVAQSGEIGAKLYLELNLYAHGRFPGDLQFVRNLLIGYQNRETRDAHAVASLLHDYWFYDDGLKRQYFEQLYQGGELPSEIAALRRDNPEIRNDEWQKLATSNPAAAQFDAEAEAWLGHFEAAAPAMRAVADLYPGAPVLDARAASLHRSLAAYFPADTNVAAAFERRAYDSNPADTKLLETVGDIYSDRNEFTRAAREWNTIPHVFPGKPDGYLEAATVFWDYYRFNDALRLVRQARVQYRDKALFAYEAGAIEEGRRDYGHAVAEYLAGEEAASEPARRRLIRLATRPVTRDLISRMTADADPQLRADVLIAQQRRADLEKYLDHEITQVTEVADIAPLIEISREQGFDTVTRQGLERQIAVSPDPVERMRLRIEFVKYLESKKDLSAATLAIDVLYRDNPLILGVVRARVEFDKRNKRDNDAIATLTDAARKARPELSSQFRFEAARIATDAGRIEQARALLTDLLKDDPWRADYLAQMAETWAAANDDAGFIRFASAEIDALKKAPLAAEDRSARIAALRRRLIVIFARRNDYAGAVDQYIDVINRYPEDESLAREAALFASAHGRNQQLVAFYRNTVAEAPRDWRWPIVLARIETALEDYPAALNAYDAAMKARPDRADLVQARAALEERLLRFDDVIRSYTRLYDLMYNDPQWLDKAAEIEAQEGRRADAIGTLERAHIGAGGETVPGLFAIAANLDEWHLYSNAADYAQRGFTLAANRLWTDHPEYADAYAKIMAESRRTDALLSLKSDESTGRRISAFQVAGAAIAELYTPEEKAALAAKLNSGFGGDQAVQALARSAGLTDVLAQSLYRQWTSGNLSAGNEWIALEGRRGRYEELARVLEQMADQPGQNVTGSLLSQAAEAAKNAGDIAAEMRIDARLESFSGFGGRESERYLSLLLARDPNELVRLAGSGAEQRRDQIAQFTIASGNERIALDTLRERGQLLPPIWLSAYTALTGLYFDDRSAGVNQAFVTAINPQTIGQRLARKADTARSLVGSIWFYYGARYGEYLARSGSARAADYLPAELELRPGDPDAYLSLARFYATANQPEKAIVEYREVLDLDANRGEAHDGIARVPMREGHRDQAISEWRVALDAFQREQSRGVRVRDSFWSNAAAAFRAIADAKVFAELEPDIHRLLADYVHRNGGYRASELITPALEASLESNAGFEWLMDVVLAGNVDLDNGEIRRQHPEQADRFRIAYDLRAAQLSNGYERDRFEQAALRARLDLIEFLLNHGRTPEAAEVWRQITPERLTSQAGAAREIEIRLAGASGSMETLLARYRAKPDTAPDIQELLAASDALRRDGHAPAALALLDFAYQRELNQQHFDMANFIGLARVDLERGDNNAALVALRRMTLVAGEPFDTFEPAADVLIDFHRDAEAREFLEEAIRATPWSSGAKLKLARISQGVERNRLALALTSAADAPYADRVHAAMLIAPVRIPAGGELALLASGNKSPEAARKPFFVEARFVAAQSVSLAAERLALLREALEIAPENETMRIAAVRAALAESRDEMAIATFQSSAPQDRQFRAAGEPAIEMRVNDSLLLESLSRAAEHTGDMQAALRFMGEAIRAEHAGADHRRMEQERDALESQEKLRAENAARAPVISTKFEQPHTVRPRQLP